MYQTLVSQNSVLRADLDEIYKFLWIIRSLQISYNLNIIEPQSINDCSSTIGESIAILYYFPWGNVFCCVLKCALLFVGHLMYVQNSNVIDQ